MDKEKDRRWEKEHYPETDGCWETEGNTKKTQTQTEKRYQKSQTKLN